MGERHLVYLVTRKVYTFKSALPCGTIPIKNPNKNNKLCLRKPKFNHFIALFLCNHPIAKCYLGWRLRCYLSTIFLFPFVGHIYIGLILLLLFFFFSESIRQLICAWFQYKSQTNNQKIITDI